MWNRFRTHTVFFTMWHGTALAAAVNGTILVFKHLRPYFKYVVAPHPTAQDETDIWATMAASVCVFFLLPL